MLLNCPKVDVDQSLSLPKESWITEYRKALTESEKPSRQSEMKPGFVKMTTNAGTIICENYHVANGKDWISELKQKAKEEAGTSAKKYSPGLSSGLFGILQNLTIDVPTETVPSVDIPKSKHPFFGVFTSNNVWEHFDIALEDRKVSISVKVGAVARVPVHPDPRWYDATCLDTLANRDSWKPPFTAADVFGEKGLLSQRINGLIAAYHIAFKATVSPDTYKKLEPHFKDARGVRIGPFSFGAGIPVSTPIPEVASKHPSAADIQTKADPHTCTFEGEYMDDYPAIIGVTVDRIPPKKTN